MSTIVYQGLQSCIESTTLKLKVASSSFMVDSDHQTTMEINKKPSSTTTTRSNLDAKSWDLFQNLSNISSSPRKESLYIHPLDRRSPSLSQESLELCTENLGSETGSDTSIEISILSNISSSFEQKHNNDKKLHHHHHHHHHHKMMNNSHDFPPPLTTMSGNSKPIHFQSHRENGRLIIEAIETPSRNSCFQAERSNGRLRLCLWKDSAINEDDDDEEEYESDVNGEENYQEDDEDDEEDEEEGIEVNKFDDEVKMGMKKFQRLGSRCKEEGFSNWKPMWVATS